MQLKTYRANSMADALAEVKRDLGKDAVILNARTLKVGGVMGIGAKPLVEVTASTAQQAAPRPGSNKPVTTPVPPAIPASRSAFVPASWPTTSASTPSPQAAPAAAVIEPKPQPVARPGKVLLSELGTVNRPAPAPSRPSRPLTVPAEIAPVDRRAEESLRDELRAIKQMVSQALRSSGGSTAVLAPPPGESGVWSTLAQRLADVGIAPKVADELIERCRRDTAAQSDARALEQRVLEEMAAMIPVAGIDFSSLKGTSTVLALVGPTGVGKTTTIAKLAADAKLRCGLRVGLITADTYRIAAVDQLRTYANIIGLPLRVVLSPTDMDAARTQMAGLDLILVDTAGRSPGDQARLEDTRAFLRAARPTQTHMVLASTSSEATLMRAVERFSVLGPDRLILTKLDETPSPGVVLNVAAQAGLPLSFVTTGQEVPDQIEPAHARRLAGIVMEAMR